MKVIIIDDNGKEFEYENFILYGIDKEKIQRCTNEVTIAEMCLAKEWLQVRITNAMNKSMEVQNGN